MSLPPPPGSRREAFTTADFVLKDSIPTPSPQASSEVSCLYEVGPCGNRQYPDIVKVLGLAGAPHGPQPTARPAQDPAPQSPSWGTDTPEPPPCCILPIYCCHMLVSWLPPDPPESPFFLSSIPPQRASEGSFHVAFGVAVSLSSEFPERHQASPLLTCNLYMVSDGVTIRSHSSQDPQALGPSLSLVP